MDVTSCVAQPLPGFSCHGFFVPQRNRKTFCQLCCWLYGGHWTEYLTEEVKDKYAHNDSDSSIQLTTLVSFNSVFTNFVYFDCNVSSWNIGLFLLLKVCSCSNYSLVLLVV